MTSNQKVNATPGEFLAMIQSCGSVTKNQGHTNFPTKNQGQRTRDTQTFPRQPCWPPVSGRRDADLGSSTLKRCLTGGDRALIAVLKLLSATPARPRTRDTQAKNQGHTNFPAPAVLATGIRPS
jgi:hypothetical protein